MPLSPPKEKQIWTYLIVTAVAVVIWFLAAGETLSERPLSAIVHFRVADADARWIVGPEQQRVTMTIKGTRLALDRAQEFARNRGDDGRPLLTIELPSAASRTTHEVMLLDALRRHSLATTGVSVESVDPAIVMIDADKFVEVVAPVRAPLPGVQTTEVSIEPSEVSISMPSAVRDRVGGEITAEAFFDRAQLERLEAGLRHEFPDVKLRPGESLAGLGSAATANVTINPNSARLAFTIRSRTRSVTLDSVRVQLGGPWEDHKEYVVEVEDPIIRDVTITGEGDLIRRIEADEVRVVAMLHLDSREKEQGITSKPIAYFVALIPDGERTRGEIVKARVNDNADSPVVRVSIARKDQE